MNLRSCVEFHQPDCQYFSNQNGSGSAAESEPDFWIEYECRMPTFRLDLTKSSRFNQFINFSANILNYYVGLLNNGVPEISGKPNSVIPWKYIYIMGEVVIIASTTHISN